MQIPTERAVTIIKSPRKKAERAREERNTEEHKEKWKKKTVSEISIHLSIITLNVNELNAPTKRYRLAE